MAQERHASRSPPERESIERFVRGTLGCRCPDEVFRSVTIDRIGTDDEGTACTRLVVGNRLLIYVLEAGASSAWPEVVARLARVGVAEREARGLARIRLVLVSSGPPESLDGAAEVFLRVVGNDEQAHLHVIGESELPCALRSG